MWKFTCPCCNTEIETIFTIDEVKEHIGATCDCPECGALLRINEDLTCIDFGEELVRRYAEMGYKVSKEEASNSRINF